MQVIIGWGENTEFCKHVDPAVVDYCLKRKQKIYQNNPTPRKENWLFIQAPFNYLFNTGALPKTTEYFDKVFAVEFRGDSEGRVCYKAELLMKKEN